jgi:hypothetical protein
MIQSAMMFALGVFVSGLVWLAFSVALVRRARRITERRLLAGIATRRAEFDTERDELRARHAVQMHRLEREVSRVLDMATAYRLEADLKERDLMIARAELDAEREDFSDIETRLTGERDNIQDLERRAAEAGSALRAAQHQLQLEIKRRASAEEALDEASILADQRRVALAALRAENNALRARLGEEPGAPLPFELGLPRLPRAVTAMDDADDAAELAAEGAARPEVGGSVVPLPTRNRPVPTESPEQSAAAVAEATRDLQRLAHEAQSNGSAEADAASAATSQHPRMPDAPVPGVANIGEFVALRMASPSEETNGEAKPDEEVGEKAESQFFEALAEIRALKRAASQAGE